MLRRRSIRGFALVPLSLDPVLFAFFPFIPNVRIPCCLFLSTRMGLYDVPSADHATSFVFLLFLPFLVLPTLLAASSCAILDPGTAAPRSQVRWCFSRVTKRSDLLP